MKNTVWRSVAAAGITHKPVGGIIAVKRRRRKSGCISKAWCSFAYFGPIPAEVKSHFILIPSLDLLLLLNSRQLSSLKICCSLVYLAAPIIPPKLFNIEALVPFPPPKIPCRAAHNSYALG
jgi:hypothetical protein